MRLKLLIPQKARLKIRLFKRFLSDRNVQFATKSDGQLDLKNTVSTEQEIKKGSFFENKRHNLAIASQKIETVAIQPNQLFSFWKTVGEPTEKNHFRKGRNIVNGVLSEEIGGGLCQLSSIIYITAVKANLEITERFNHSLDIYREEERFTPLGADATVVYGYKDLRIRNTFPFPIRFSFTFEKDNISCHLWSPEKIEESQLDFIRNHTNGTVEVSTTKNGKPYCLSVYKKVR
ncbi:VanW family protein [Flavobacterium humi]|uniref:Vancomycin B-type resistance protein n=1 Tax=Flavobacterium humi TaxID=2562683 RepID=A0A4Z0L7N6_9FLAO|nr:VanW family protein [Flavobacterium humi]TGD57004.1 vancomycin B-type resistance protein [Flavobacterium humi]